MRNLLNNIIGNIIATAMMAVFLRVLSENQEELKEILPKFSDLSDIPFRDIEKYTRELLREKEIDKFTSDKL